MKTDEKLFIQQMADEVLKQAGITMSEEAAFNIALVAYRLYKSDIQASFGHEDYDWSAAGARDVIWEYEISHWDDV